MERWLLVTIALAALISFGGWPERAHADGTDPASEHIRYWMASDPSTPEGPARCPSGRVTLTGWLTTIWGESPRYWIADGQGRAVEVRLPEDVTRPYGGPQALDRHRVRLVGELVGHDPPLVRVLSVTPVAP